VGSRDYDPATGQYLSRPPAAANALAPYAFAGDDPVNWAFTSLTWSPVAQSPGFWEQYGLTIVGIAVDFITDQQEPTSAGSGAGLAVDEATDEEIDEAAEVEATEGASFGSVQNSAIEEDGTPSVAGTGLSTDEDMAETLTDDDGDPVTGSSGLVNTPPEADDEGQPPSPSCWGLPGINTSCRQLLVTQLKQVDIKGLIDFIHDSIDAAQTCSDPHKSNWECAQKALEALKGVPDIKKEEDGD
jgi:hypothetical protein